MKKRIIKKYRNRKLYDTYRSKYITHGDLIRILKGGYDFEIVTPDGNDVTKETLLQVIATKPHKFSLDDLKYALVDNDLEFTVNLEKYKTEIKNEVDVYNETIEKGEY